MSLLRLFLTILALCTISGCATTPYSKDVHAASVATFKKQMVSADKQINSAPAAVNVIYTGFALSSESNAFQGDILAGKSIANRLDKNHIPLLFSNKQDIDKAKFPFATEDDIDLGFAGTAQLADAALKHNGKPPLILILMTSHGNEGYLAVNADGWNRPLLSSKLTKLLEPLKNYPTILIISACHSGSLIPDLKNDNRIILTAAAAGRTSFGCHPADNRTWYIDALAKAFDAKKTLRQWHEQTTQLVADREVKSKHIASQPQIWIGKNMTILADSELGSIASLPHLNAEALASQSGQ